MHLIDDIVAQAPAIGALRREIHAHPELNFEEMRTVELVACKLGEWGIPVHRGLATTSVVGIVHGCDGGASGRAVGLRADMDALPMQEHNRFAHASRFYGRMHACGHDGHVAMLLAAAQHFATQRHFDGTVCLIFQPAEGGGGGARVMVEEGLFERFPMEAVFGMHNWPGYLVGTLAVSPGPVMASASFFHIVVRGVGGHAATPHRGIDPVPVACQLVMGLQHIVSRNCKPTDTAVIMLQAKAGAYCFIGNGDGAHREHGHGEGPCMPHNPSYDFNDALIPLGATCWVQLAEAWLGGAAIA